MSTTTRRWDAAESAQRQRMFTLRVAPWADSDKQSWLGLCRLLLSHGGELAVPQDNFDASEAMLLTEGQLWSPTGLVTRKGRPRDCHANTARMFRAGAVHALGTGYALSNDGLWRQHSWGLRARKAGEVVVETTTRRELYFGLRLAGDAAATFSSAQR